MAYVYRHIRKDTDQVFYIGIGTDSNGKYTRAKSINRNRYWKRIASKTDYEVEILFDDISKEEAINKEIEFIQLYGRRDLGIGTLCNLTDGGEGVVNMSEEGKEKLREIRRNTKMPQEQKDKYSKMFKGSGNPNSSKVIHKHTLNVYGSILEAANEYRINKRTLGNNLNVKNCNYSDFYYYSDYIEKGIEKLEEERLLKIKKVQDVLKKERSLRASKKVINVNTKEIFNTIIDAAKSINITGLHLSSMLTGRNKNKTEFIFYKDYIKKEGN